MKTSRTAYILFLTALSFVLPSCSSDRKPVYPVTGHVLNKQKPIVGATVIFHPVHATPEDLVKPTGRVDEHGNFILTTYSKGDGAPEGDYIVTVEWPAPKRSLVDSFPSDRLQGRYSDPRSSTLRAHVERQANDLELRVQAVR